jgi:hypothetical protein
MSVIATSQLQERTSATVYPQLFQEMLLRNCISHIRNLNFLSADCSVKKKLIHNCISTPPQSNAEVRIKKIIELCFHGVGSKKKLINMDL